MTSPRGKPQADDGVMRGDGTLYFSETPSIFAYILLLLRRARISERRLFQASRESIVASYLDSGVVIVSTISHNSL